MNGWFCPEGHGRLIPMERALYCPNQDHDGRPKSHPEGKSPRTRAFFDYAEAIPQDRRMRRGA